MSLNGLVIKETGRFLFFLVFHRKIGEQMRFWKGIVIKETGRFLFLFFYFFLLGFLQEGRRVEGESRKTKNKSDYY